MTGAPLRVAKAAVAVENVVPQEAEDAAAGVKLATSVAPAGPAMTSRVPSAVAPKPPAPAVTALASAWVISVRVSMTTAPLPRFTLLPTTTEKLLPPFSVTFQLSPATGVPLRSSTKAAGAVADTKLAAGVTDSVGVDRKLPAVFLTMVRLAPLADAV